MPLPVKPLFSHYWPLFFYHIHVNRCIVLLVLFMRWPHHPSSFCTNDILLNPVTSNQKLSSASKFASLYWSYDFFKLVLAFPKLDLFWRSWCRLPHKIECDLYIWFADQVTRAMSPCIKKYNRRDCFVKRGVGDEECRLSVETRYMLLLPGKIIVPKPTVGSDCR